MTPAEQHIWDEAIAFARSNKKAIGRRLTTKEQYPPEEEPVSVFMAGSPGAGKTEASIALVNFFADTAILRIDPDELRNEFATYTGGNSWLFQGESQFWSKKSWITLLSRSNPSCWMGHFQISG